MGNHGHHGIGTGKGSPVDSRTDPGHPGLAHLGLGSYSIAGPFEPAPARMNPARAPYGLAQDQPMVMGPYLPMHIPCGPQVGFVWARAGASGLPIRAPLKSTCNPGQIPDVAQTGLGPGRLACPLKSRTGPGRARYLGLTLSKRDLMLSCLREWSVITGRGRLFVGGPEFFWVVKWGGPFFQWVKGGG